MQRLPLIGGAYYARSVIANAQRCVNLYPEVNRDDAPTKFTNYQRPGLVPLVSPGSPGAGRAIYRASNGDGYVVIGDTLYYVSPNWTLYTLGNFTGFVVYDSTTPCSMIDNGLQLLVVNGMPYADNANGTILFATNPSPADTITLNGVVFTFIAGATSGTNIHIGATLGETIVLNLLPVLQASTNASLTVAVYHAVGDGGTGVYLTINYLQPGAIGTTYTLAASAATPSGAALELGPLLPGGGWTVDLGTTSGSSFTAITDASWTGADRVDYLDTFIIWNVPGTNEFGSTLSNQIEPLDATYFAAKTTYSDHLQSLIVNRGQIALIGDLKSEVWYNAGNAQFPFALIQGSPTEHGAVAKYSLVSADVNVYWLGNDLQGRAIVYRMRGYEAKRISNHALEHALQQMEDVSDAVGYTYQMDGHLFYVLSFPTGNQTWVWDESIGDPDLGWSQRAWVDSNGGLNRDRGGFGANLYGKNVVLDWENGTIYEQDLTAYTDTVLGQEYPLLYLRTFPHLMAGTNPQDGTPILANGKIVQHDRFALDIECGTVENLQEPTITLRWSDDRGATWGSDVLLSAGAKGKYITRPDWRGLGQAMDRVYEVSWSYPGKVALNGAWVEGRVVNQ